MLIHLLIVFIHSKFVSDGGVINITVGKNNNVTIISDNHKKILVKILNTVKNIVKTGTHTINITNNEKSIILTCKIKSIEVTYDENFPSDYSDRLSKSTLYEENNDISNNSEIDSTDMANNDEKNTIDISIINNTFPDNSNSNPISETVEKTNIESDHKTLDINFDTDVSETIDNQSELVGEEEKENGKNVWVIIAISCGALFAILIIIIAVIVTVNKKYRQTILYFLHLKKKSESEIEQDDIKDENEDSISNEEIGINEKSSINSQFNALVTPIPRNDQPRSNITNVTVNLGNSIKEKLPSINNE